MPRPYRLLGGRGVIKVAAATTIGRKPEPSPVRASLLSNCPIQRISGMTTSKNWFLGRRLNSSAAGRGSRRRLVTYVTVTVTGTLLSWALFSMVRDRMRSERLAEFEQLASEVAADLQANFDRSLEHLRSVPPFFAASENVTRDDFRMFVSPALQRQPSMYVSAFLPRVAATEIESFEAIARKEGFEDYKVRAVDVAGEEIPLEQHDHYLPIYYTEPAIPSVWGIDLGSHPEQATYVERACGTDQPVVTPPLSLIEDPADVLSVIAFLSVRLPKSSTTTACDGIALVILRVRPLVEETLGASRLDELQLVLTDVDASGTRRPVHKNFPGDAASIRQSGQYVVEREVSFADQTWTMELAPAAGSAFASGTPPYWILASGIVLSLLAAHSLSARIAIDGLKRQVDQALKLGQYQLDEKIGSGGMGDVYRARHAMLKRPTAVKLLKANSSNELSLARFEREVQLSSQLTHPNTIQIYDYGQNGSGDFYYAMEYLDGIDLSRLIQSDGPLPPGRVVHILLQVCGALGEAHDHGLIHRDVKPANIMLTRRGGVPDFVKVLDFGLAKETASPQNPTLTMPDVVVGTPLYFSPEATKSAANLDQRSDIYSLGVVAYEMLSGRPPFDGDSAIEICLKHASDAPTPLFGSNATDAQQRLGSIVMRCLEKTPDKRPQSVHELASSLHLVAHMFDEWTDSDAVHWWDHQRTAEEDAAVTVIC